MPRRTTPERTQCMQCGGWDAPGLYHPHTFCVLVQHYGGSVERARLSINAVLDYGRKLERLGLPNDTRLGLVHQMEEVAERARERLKAAIKRPPKKAGRSR